LFPDFESKILIEDHFNWQVMNIFLNMYLMALGEFETIEAYDDVGERSPALWIVFIFATFVLQLLFLNMIIGIMATTQGKITETKDSACLQNKLKVMADFRFVVVDE
jgi:hypothetical protein